MSKQQSFRLSLISGNKAKSQGVIPGEYREYGVTTVLFSVKNGVILSEV